MRLRGFKQWTHTNLSYPTTVPLQRQDKVERELDFCVSNPLTGHSVKLPTFRIPDSSYPWSYGLATRAPQPEGGTQDYVTYKVVLIHFFTHRPRTADSADLVQIDIFSSDTGRWTCKERMKCSDVILYFDRPRAFSYKGILHLFDWNTRNVVTYDPYDNPGGFGSIQLPSGSGKKLMNPGLNLIHLGHEDLLKFGEIEDCSDDGWRLCVWRLVNYDKREWCLEKRCPISPLWSVLSNCRLPVAPDPLNAEFFCCFLSNNDKISVYDLASAEKVSVDPFEVKEELAYFASRLASKLVPIALNPWSSPFHGEPGRNSSSEAGYRKIIPAWFPSFTK